MKKILVPTDFSETAINAANYAIGFAKQMRIDCIELINCWQPITIADPMIAMTVSEVDSIRETSESNLQAEKKRVEDLTPLHIAVTTKSLIGSLENTVAEECLAKDVSYIIMGITGGGTVQEKLIGSNTISVSQSTDVPLIIVPKNCTYNIIGKAMLLCDFNDIDKTLPEESLVNFLENIQPQLDVVNFDPNFKREEDAAAFEKFYLHNILRKYAPNYKYSLRNDFEDAVNELAEISNVQIIINISKKHSWLYKILHPSYTKTLAFHTTLPLMILHN